MRKTILKSTFLTALFGLLSAFSTAPTPVLPDALENGIFDNTCASENNTFQDGEKVTYKLFYNWKFVWIAAGEVTFSVTEMEDQYYFSAFGRTYKSYDPIFMVRDSYECYVDK